MDLRISVFLLFVPFTAGHPQYCYECLTDYCIEKMVKCPISSSGCTSSTIVLEMGDISSKVNIKSCSFDCQSGTMNLGMVKTSSSCCDTYLCNAQDAPDPRTLVPNGKKCYYCDGRSCLNILSCSGSEDHCIKATTTFEGWPVVVKGCASKSVCNTPTSTTIKDISCCWGNLCNGAKSVTQSFLFLCCSLLSFILMY